MRALYGWLIATCVAVTTTAYAEDAGYYVDNGDGNLTHVPQGDPSRVQPSAWHIRLYKPDQSTGGDDNWGLITGDSAAEVTRQLERNQKLQIWYDTGLGTDYRRDPFTYFNPLGPIAVFKTCAVGAARKDRADEALSRISKLGRALNRATRIKRLGSTTRQYANQLREAERRVRGLKKVLDTCVNSATAEIDRDLSKLEAELGSIEGMEAQADAEIDQAMREEGVQDSPSSLPKRTPSPASGSGTQSSAGDSPNAAGSRGNSPSDCPGAKPSASQGRGTARVAYDFGCDDPSGASNAATKGGQANANSASPEKANGQAGGQSSANRLDSGAGLDRRAGAGNERAASDANNGTVPRKDGVNGSDGCVDTGNGVYTCKSLPDLPGVTTVRAPVSSDSTDSRGYPCFYSLYGSYNCDSPRAQEPFPITGGKCAWNGTGYTCESLPPLANANVVSASPGTPPNQGGSVTVAKIDGWTYGPKPGAASVPAAPSAPAQSNPPMRTQTNQGDSSGGTRSGGGGALGASDWRYTMQIQQGDWVREVVSGSYRMEGDTFVYRLSVTSYEIESGRELSVRGATISVPAYRVAYVESDTPRKGEHALLIHLKEGMSGDPLITLEDSDGVTSYRRTARIRCGEESRCLQQKTALERGFGVAR